MKHKTTLISSLVVAFALVATFAFVASAGIGDDLVGYWAFDEGSGTTALDDSGNSNDGSIDGGAVYTTSDIAPVAGNEFALTFDGTDDFVRVPQADELDMTGAYTFSVWVDVTDVPSNTYRPILFRGDVDANDIEVYVQAVSGNLIVAHNRGNGGTFDFVGFENPPVGDLFHLVITFDGTDVRAYYDGVAASVVKQSTAVAVPDDTDKGWWIGKVDHTAFGTLSGGDDINLFKGLLDEVRIYDRVISDVEMAILSGSDYTVFGGGIEGQGDEGKGNGKGEPTHSFEGSAAVLNGTTVGEVVINYHELDEVCTFTPGTFSLDNAPGVGVTDMLRGDLEGWTNSCGGTARILVLDRDANPTDIDAPRGAIFVDATDDSFDIDIDPGTNTGPGNWEPLDRGNVHVVEQ